MKSMRFVPHQHAGRIGAVVLPILAAACSSSDAAEPDGPSNDASILDASVTDASPVPHDAAIDGQDAAAPLDAASDVAVAPSTTITNFDDAMNEVVRFDVDGNAIDAHDGALYLFDGTYWLYGTSYDCGYLYRGNSSFCGFKAYSSTDLVHFVDRGFVVPPQTCQYCFRPHVIHDVANGRYVLWVNSANGTGDLSNGPYTVFTNPTPSGKFTRVGSPPLNRPNAIDFGLFVDDDAAHTGYLLHNDTNSPLNHGGTADLVIEKLNADYTAPILGPSSFVELGLTDVESPAAFVRNGTYYIAMSDPTCAYCNTSTGYVTAQAMLGPWQGITTLSPPGLNQNGSPEVSPDQRSTLISGDPTHRQDTDSCNTQPAHVASLPLRDGGTAFLYMGDQWQNRAANESLAGFFWGPLDFDADGGIAALACPKAVTLDLATATIDHDVDPPDLDSAIAARTFRAYCDIGSNNGSVSRMQTFVAKRSGTLTHVSLTSFRRGNPGSEADTPNQPLILDVVDAATSPNGPVLSTSSVPSDAIGWSPRNVVVSPNIPVIAGHTYGVRAHSSTTTGCYGWVYDDSDVYAGGMELLSTDGAATFTAETKRDWKMWTAVR